MKTGRSDYKGSQASIFCDGFGDGNLEGYLGKIGPECATRIMIDQVEEKYDMKPARLVGDTN